MGHRKDVNVLADSRLGDSESSGAVCSCAVHEGDLWNSYGIELGVCIYYVSTAPTIIETFANSPNSGLVGAPISGRLESYGWLAVSMYAGAVLATAAALLLVCRLRRSWALIAKV